MAAIERACNCFRIGVGQWMASTRFDGLLALLEKYKGVTDQVTFFTSETHPPLPLDVIAERAAILRMRMDACRRRGYGAGINILATLGHHNENLSHSLDTDFTRMTDIDGSVCAGSFCPNDEHMRGYIARLYRLVAEAGPDYIWIDDDVRLLGHMPVGKGCFCEKCLEIFEKETGAEYTRETLRHAFHNGSTEQQFAVRRAWLRHNRDTLARLFLLIEKTVHEVKPGMPLGFMTGERYFEGYDFDAWAAILAGPRHAPVMWRPGGGAYTDESLDAFVQKAHQIGRQVAFLPESVICIQSEIENFPYQRLRKSAHAVALEAGLYIAAGCTGAAYNVLSMYDEPLDEYESLVAKLNERRPFLDLLTKHLGRVPPSGIYTGWNKDTFACRWGGYAPDPADHANELFAAGLPVAYLAAHAPAAALSGDSVLALSDADIRALFSRGVYMDAAALVRLNEMGYADLTGFTIEKTVDVDSIEQFLPHPINGPFAGRRRDGRQSFWKNPCACLRPSGPGAISLARVVDYAREEVAPCSMGLFENALGGRVCVAGYYPWTDLHNLSKSSQMKTLFRWLSRDTLPGYVESFHRVNLWIRPGPNSDRFAVALCNSCLDPAREIALILKTNAEIARFWEASLNEIKLEAADMDAGYRKFVIPNLGPWEVGLLVV